MIEENIKKVFQSKITDDELAKITGMSRQGINKYRTGKSQIENMKLKHAIKLDNYYKKTCKG